MTEQFDSNIARTGRRIVQTSSWKLAVPPTVDAAAPLLVIPTVHPRGDRRIVRCAQVALDSGFRVHFLWLGEGDDVSFDVTVGETLLPSPRSAAERIGRVAQTYRLASELRGDMWHIHDFYFLSHAKRWRKKTGNPVLYDVHEYYPEYYSSKLPLPAAVQGKIARMLERYQVRAAGVLGAANVVTEKMAEPFRASGVPVAVSANFPMLAQFVGLPSIPFVQRRWQVLHIGTLSAEYGTSLLLDIARRSEARNLPFEFSAIGRFPSREHEQAFGTLLDASGRPSNLRLLSVRPAHEMPALLEHAGFGLSLLTEGGQNEAAVPSKNYEHVMAGLVNVVSDRRAQRAFSERHGVSVSSDGDNADVILDRMLELANHPERTEEALISKAVAARERFTWERAVEPALNEMFVRLARGCERPIEKRSNIGSPAKRSRRA